MSALSTPFRLVKHGIVMIGVLVFVALLDISGVDENL